MSMFVLAFSHSLLKKRLTIANIMMLCRKQTFLEGLTLIDFRKFIMLGLVRKGFKIVFEVSLWLISIVVVIGSLFMMANVSFWVGLFALIFGAVGVVLYGGVVSIFINIDANLEKMAKFTEKMANNNSEIVDVTVSAPSDKPEETS